jgi:methylmalonyl-CoA mutase N-terminal domain/subunit
VQALAAALGGTQSLHTNAYDEALALPSEQSATLALRTQQILAHESGLMRSVDPLAGSWFVEELTDRIEREARALIVSIDEIGGAAKAIERGVMQQAIANSAWEQQQAIESGQQVIVGVNRFTSDDHPTPLHPPDYQALEAGQVARLKSVRSGRNADLVTRQLLAVREAARGPAPLMPVIVEAVRARATLGEISDALRAEWGTYVG